MTRDASALFWERDLQLIFGVTLMAVLGIASITPAFPEIGRALDLSSQAVGGLITAFTLPGVILTPVLGALADWWGRKAILVPSLLLFGLAGGACALARDFDLLLGLRVLQGVGAASLGTLNVTLIGDLYKGEERATAMGYNASVLSVGTAAYPALGGALATFGWYWPFALPVLAIPIGLLVLLALETRDPTRDQRIRFYFRAVWEGLRDRRVIGLLLLILVTFLVLYGSYLTYVPFLMESAFRASSLVIGLMMSAMSLATALASSQLGRLSSARSERTVLLVAFVLYAASLALIPLAPGLGAMVLPTLLFGVAQGLNIPILQTLLAGAAPIEYRAMFMALNSMTLRLGQTLGPPLMGWVYGLYGIGTVFYVGAGLSLVMLVLASVLIDG